MEAKVGKTILIISTDLQAQEMIEDYARQSSQSVPKIKTTASFGQDAAWWAKNAPHVLVVSLPEEALLQTQFLMKLRAEVPKNIPLMLICDLVSAGIMQMTTVFSKVRILKAPLEAEKIFQGLNDLFADFQPGRQQAAPRFPTNQAAEVTSPGITGRMPVVLKNLSNSGAYFEAPANSLKISINHLVKIEVKIPGIREYSFPAKVVWVKALENGHFGFGVNFTENS